MFEAVELGRKVSRSEYDAAERDLHTRLLEAQREIVAAKIPLIIIVSGVEGAGKGGVVNLLNTWLDTRGMQTHAFWDIAEEERERPRYWRFWRALPARGAIGILFGSWYTQPIVDRALKRIKRAEFDRQLHRIHEFEQLLTDDGALIVKCWYHLSQADQQKRLRQDLKAHNAAPILKRYARSYDKFVAASERAIRVTDTGPAPWHLIEATDWRYRNIETGRVLLQAMQRRLARPSADSGPAPAAPLVATEPQHTVLATLDVAESLTDKDYARRLARAQKALQRLAWQAWERKLHSVAVFEGWDAAGKGGAIRRVTAAVDARLYRAISIAAPTDEERAHHYLWRFWRHIPRGGQMTIYDRSWYGRVLVERVEGFATQDEWLRAYQEINDFEEQLVEHGVVLCKFWLHITAEEQLKRFKERESIAWKQHKITDEDWRNRDKWAAYEAAVNEMVARTSTADAPWTLVPANDKRRARVMVVETISQRLSSALSGG